MEQRSKEDRRTQLPFYFQDIFCHSYILSVELHLMSVKLGGGKYTLETFSLQSSIQVSHSRTILYQQTVVT